MTQSDVLTILCHASADAVKHAAEQCLPQLEAGLSVQQNRTGLVMLPCRDPVHGTLFHLGEVLVSQAQLERHGTIGYGVVLGRDLEQAVAVALLDLAWQSGLDVSAFLLEQQKIQLEADRHLMQKVEATRVNMETF
jgi:alpha-D-ribose 1-methylphosphonate 5-triphosphate synthase subunit PhnG